MEIHAYKHIQIMQSHQVPDTDLMSVKHLQQESHYIPIPMYEKSIALKNEEQEI